MATKAEVRQRIGEDLGLVPVGQALEAQDDLRIDAAVDEAYARLQEKGLDTWPSAGPVPAKLVPSFCLMVAQKLLISYSVPESRYIRISNDAGPNGTIALQNLAALAVPSYEEASEVSDY